ncbi:hypothetical protein MMC14_003675 [Varicellaria rhodocarpa]|nr:hypothetical protein [Varicellaria rhodocarpa]
MASTDPPAPEIRYTVFIKVPIPRGDFVDPPAVHWDSAKDGALWKVLSSSGKGSEIDWHALADQFDVPLPFLLQQSAWLYEQQLSQVREQLRKVKPSVNLGVSPVPSSISGSVSTGGVAVGRTSSGGSRVPSSLSVRARESPNLRDDLSAPSTPTQLKVPPFSRTSSTNTVYQTQRAGSGLHLRRESSPRPSRLSLEADRPSSKDGTSRRTSLRPQPEPEPEPSSPLAETSSPSSSSSSSDNLIPLSRSRAFPRRPRFSTTKPAGALISSADEAEDEDDDPPAFLPFSTASKPPTNASSSSRPPRHPQPHHDPSATLRLSLRSRPPLKPSSITPPDVPLSSSTTNHPTSSSPTSSSTSLPQTSSSSNNPRPTILSPRQRQALIKEGSDGTPSMGSSFSDLDDASVTQSALEEALVREMGQGGGSSAAGSRISLVGVGRALRSRYL